MASLSALSSPMTDTQQDPWYFGIEEVITILIGPPGIIPSALYPDLGGLSNLIRREHIVGQVLLTGINDTNLRDIMGVKALGERVIILNAVVELRARSAKYKLHRRAVLTSSAKGPASAPNMRRVARRIAPTPVAQVDDDFAEAFQEDDKWDYLLERYTPKEGETDKLLPHYGESGSEGEYDTDDIEDIAPEDRAALLNPIDPINQNDNTSLPPKSLTKDEISATIEKVNTQIIDTWKLENLPGLESKALQFWTQAERDNDRQDQIGYSSREIIYLESRLAALQEGIAGQKWTNSADLERLCTSTERTVEELEEHRWMADLLQQTSPPRQQQQNPNTESESEKHHESLAGNKELAGKISATENSGNHHRSNNVVDLVSSSEEDSEYVNPFSEECMTESLNTAPTSLLQRADEHLKIPSSEVTSILGVKDEPGTSSPEVLDLTALSDTSESPETSNEFPEVLDLTALSDASESPETSNEFSAILDLAAPSNTFTSPKTTSVLPGILDLAVPSNAFETLEASNAKARKVRFAENQTIHVFETSSDFQPLSDVETDPLPKVCRRRASKRRTFPPESTVNPFATARAARLTNPPVIPELWEVDKIHSTESALWEVRNDRQRLVIWVIAETRLEHQTDIARDIHIGNPQEVQSCVWACLEALKSPDFDPDRLASVPERHQHGRSVTRLTFWFLTWMTCTRYTTYRGISLATVQAALADAKGFKKFFKFLLNHFSESARPKKRQREVE
ncbi:hypothetical protein MMC14_010277 [Varicellaria rhodocarpa]|nr:hypothetical protein [Varicellaria rhodocarpa]